MPGKQGALGSTPIPSEQSLTFPDMTPQDEGDIPATDAAAGSQDNIHLMNDIVKGEEKMEGASSTPEVSSPETTSKQEDVSTSTSGFADFTTSSGYTISTEDQFVQDYQNIEES